MQNEDDNRGVKFSVKVYGYLLALYPPKYRREFGADMMQLFRDQCRDAWRAAGDWGLAGLWVRTLPDLGKTSMHQQFAAWKKRSAFVRVFAIAFCCSLACAAVAANIFPVPYSSTVRITVDRDHRSDPSFLTTQCKFIKSYPFLTNVIAYLSLNEKLATQTNEQRWPINKTADYLGRRVTVQMHNGTGIIDVFVNNTNSILAAEIAEGLGRVYCYDANFGKDAPGERDLIIAFKDAATQAVARSNYKELYRLENKFVASMKLTDDTRAIKTPATQAIPVLSTLKILLIWIGSATLVAVVAGSLGRWIFLAKRRLA